jgi:hypothetical protein
VAQCPGERALKHAAAPGELALGHLAASHDPRSVIAPDGHALEALASHARTLAPATASHYRAPGSPPNMRLLDVGGRLDLHMLGSTSGRWEPGEAPFFFSSSCRTVPVSVKRGATGESHEKKRRLVVGAEKQLREPLRIHTNWPLYSEEEIVEVAARRPLYYINIILPVRFA